MGRRSICDAIERALALGGLIAAACLPLLLHLVRRLLRVPTREEREWAAIEEALYGCKAPSTAIREAPP